MKSALITALLVNAAVSIPASAAWQRLGSLDRRPVDLSSVSIHGVAVASSNGVGQPENLIADDVAVSSKLSAGASEAVIDIGKQTVIEIVSFVNEGAEGRVAVSGSGDKKSWTPLGRSIFTAADRSVIVKFAGASAKYVRLEWDLSKAGDVKSVDTFGARSDRSFKKIEDVPPSPSAKAVNVANGLGGTRVIYVNPSPVRGEEVGTKYGRFEFPESPEKFRTVIYDFGMYRTLTELGSTHSPRPVRFAAYAFEKDLPEMEDWRGRKSFDPAVFDSMKPVATVEDSRGLGYVKTKLAKPVRARYVALRWEPDFNPPAFVVTGVNIAASVVEDAEVIDDGGGDVSGGSPPTNPLETPDGGGGGPSMNAFSNPFSISSAGYAGSPGIAVGSPGAGNGAAGKGKGKNDASKGP